MLVIFTSCSYSVLSTDGDHLVGTGFLDRFLERRTPTLEIYRQKTLTAFTLTLEMSVSLRQSEPHGRQVGAPVTRGSRVQTTHCFLLPLALFLP